MSDMVIVSLTYEGYLVMRVLALGVAALLTARFFKSLKSPIVLSGGGFPHPTV